MELLRGYSESESENEDEIPTLENPSLSPHLDYFGINSSSDDDSNGHQNVQLSIDPFIESYRLNNVPTGPQRETVEEAQMGNGDVDNSKLVLRRGRMTKRPRRIRTSIAARADAKPDSSVNPAEPVQKINIFETHPLIRRAIDEPRVSIAPRQVGWRLRGHTSCVNTLHWGAPPDISHLLLSASMDGSVRIWNALNKNAGTSVWQKSVHGGVAVKCARWSPEGRVVASGGYDRMVRLTNVEKGEETFRGKHAHFVTCLKYHRETQQLLTGTLGCVECWDTRQGGDKSIRSYRADFQEVEDIEFLPNGNEFVCCSNLVSRDSADKAIMAWDFRTGAILSNQIFHERYHCTQLRLHPSDAYFLAQTNGNYIALFSTSRPYKMNTKKRFAGHKVEGYRTGFDVSLDGCFVYSGSANGLFYKYDFQRGNLLGTFPVSDAPCLATECHPLLSSIVAVSDWKGGVHICH